MRKFFTAATHNGQFEHNQVVAALRFVTVNPIFLGTLTIVELPECQSPVGVEETNKQLATQGTLTPDPASDDGFDHVSKDRLQLKTPTMEEWDEADKIPKTHLADDQIIALAQALHISYVALHTGHSGFQTGFVLIEKRSDEEDIDFAKRRLFALRPPLLSVDPETATEKEKMINDWHRASRIDPEKITDNPTLKKALLLDQALAETAFYFEQNKLVIRHTPIEATTTENSRVAYELIYDVTKKILEKLLRESQLKEDIPIQINHVIPHIQPGLIAQLEKMLAEFSNLISIQKLMQHARNFVSGAMSFLWRIPQMESKPASKVEPETEPDSKHITVMVAHEVFQYDELVKEEKLEYQIYREREQSKKPWTRIFDPREIGAQRLNNDIDCGRHVAIMATIFAHILANELERHAQHLSKGDLTKHDAVSHAQYCTRATDITRLLTQLAHHPSDESQMQAERMACVVAHLGFLIDKPKSDSCKFFAETELTMAQKAAATELRSLIIKRGEIVVEDFLMQYPTIPASPSLWSCLKLATGATTPTESSADSTATKSPSDSDNLCAKQPHDCSSSKQSHVMVSPTQ